MKKTTLAFLVDDDPVDQKFFQMAFSRLTTQVNCEFADNGPEALELLAHNQNFKPDFIFLDINMPLIDGLECLREMRSLEKLKHLPIYMYSTSTDEHITKSCMLLGATGVIKKVPSVNALKEVLNEIVFKKKNNL